MQVILFSKMFKDKSPQELVELGRGLGIDGYDMAVRPDYPVNPDNAADELPRVVELLAQNGLSVPMVTGNFDLLYPDHPTAEPIVSAMGKAGVKCLKLGYYKFNPQEQDYWAEVEKIRKGFEGWQELGRRHNVTICYHTHSNRCMGLNAGMLMHLLQGFDPRYIGAYLDSAHLQAEGEEFAVALQIVRKHLALIALKDVMIHREERNGHGVAKRKFPVAGQGMCDFTAIFSELKRIGYTGPISVHCEFEVPKEEFMDAVKREVAFFKKMRDAVA